MYSPARLGEEHGLPKRSCVAQGMVVVKSLLLVNVLRKYVTALYICIVAHFHEYAFI